MAGDKKTALLLHGGGLGPWQWKEAAAALATRFEIVAPALDGHPGGGAPFTTIEASARRLLSLIDERYQGHVALIAGLSLGAQVLLTMLALRPDVCDAAVIESALTLPMPVTRALVGPCARLAQPLTRRRWFARWQFRSLGLPEPLFEDYCRDTRQISADSLAAMLRANAAYRADDRLTACKARLLILAGGRERPIMRRSARRLHTLIPGSELDIAPGYRHGAWSILHPREYADRVMRFLGE